MIPRAVVTEWREKVLWAQDQQVEHDLIISRALVEIFSDDQLSSGLAFRGGTALHKLYFAPAERYSEDIDLVQSSPGSIGPLLQRLRERLAWLGKAAYGASDKMHTLTYRYDAATVPPVRMKLKVEINTREHFAQGRVVKLPFTVRSQWFSGQAAISTYCLEELLATKLRALYQRKKGRDLFDLDRAIHENPLLPNLDLIVEYFQEYMAQGGTPVSQQEFRTNLDAKRADLGFRTDVAPLLVASAPDYSFDAGLERVLGLLISRLP